MHRFASWRWSSSAATSGRCGGSRRSCGRRAPRRTRRRPKLLPRAPSRAGRRAGGEARRPAVARAGARARAPGARAAPFDDPGSVSRAPSPRTSTSMRVPRRAARVPQGRGAAPGRDLVGSRSARELSWLGVRSGPRATSTCCRAPSGTRSRSSARTPACAGILDVLEGEAGELPVGPWSRRSRATAIATSSTAASTSARPALVGAGDHAQRAWCDAWKRARRKLERLDRGSADEELHHARIKLKRARYAAEPAAPELGKPGRRLRGRPRPGCRTCRDEPGRDRRRGPAAHLGGHGGGRCRGGAARATRARPQGGGPGAPAGRLERAPPDGQAGRMSVVRAAAACPRVPGSAGLRCSSSTARVPRRTFPKGKCYLDESDEACALREVEEETGLRVRSRTSRRRPPTSTVAGATRSRATGGSTSSAASRRSTTRSTRRGG